MSDKAKKLKNFLSDIVLSDLETITLGELQVLKIQINKKLRELKDSVDETKANESDIEKYNDIILTTLTLKAIIGLANKIAKENGSLL